MTHFKHRLRRALVWLHLWAGLTVGSWFVVMGLSGSVMAWHQPMVTWEFARRTPPGDGPIIPPSQAIAAMQAAHPEFSAAELSFFIPPSDVYASYIFFSVTPNPMLSRFYLIDPHTGRELPGFRIIDTVTGIAESLHVALLLPVRGEHVNGILALLTLPLLITGVWLWWPASLKQLKTRLTIRRGASPLRLLYDIHNILGAYGLPLLVVLTVTTIVLVVESVYHQPLEAAASRAAGHVVAPPIVQPAGRALSVDELLPIAQAAVPGGSPLVAIQPSKPDQPFRATIQIAGGGTLFPNRTVYVNPYTAEVMRVDNGSDAPAVVKLVTSSEAVHSGTWGGVISRLLYTFAGLIPLGLYITGFMRWRRRAKVGTTPRTRKAKQRTAIVP